VTLGISDTQHNNALPCAERPYAECRILFTIMLSVIMLYVVMLSVIMLNIVMLRIIMLNIVMLSVVAPPATRFEVTVETNTLAYFGTEEFTFPKVLLNLPKS
jgi:hypothetical protein